MHRATDGGRAPPAGRPRSGLLAVAGRARKPCCKGRAGQRHSLRGDVEADVSVLPQHVQHRAHGCPPSRGAPLPPTSPRAAVATGAVSRAPAAIGIGCGPARGRGRGVPALPPGLAPPPARLRWRRRQRAPGCLGAGAGSPGLVPALAVAARLYSLGNASGLAFVSASSRRAERSASLERVVVAALPRIF